MIKYLDFDGKETDEQFFLNTFGDITIEGQSNTYHVSELRALEGPASIVVTVLNADGSPREGVPVLFSWPDGDVEGSTDGGGAVGFGLGGGAYYWPPGPGPHWVTVDGLSVHGLGMIGGTNHQHVNPVYRAGETPEPPPPPTGFDIIDKHGNPRDAAWLKHYFGTVEHHIAEETVAFRLIELREVDGGDCKITVQDDNGNPLPGISVSFRRADGGGGSRSDTDTSGVALFPLEDDAKYPVPGQGPYLTVIRNQASDAVIGLGQVMDTPRHLDVTFRAGGSIPEPQPPTPDETSIRWAMLFEKLDRIIELLERT